MTRTTEGHVVRNAADLQPGDQIVTTLAAGQLTSRVESTEDQKTH
jgi:exonuclease VII large subunit